MPHAKLGCRSTDSPASRAAQTAAPRSPSAVGVDLRLAPRGHPMARHDRPRHTRFGKDACFWFTSGSSRNRRRRGLGRGGVDRPRDGRARRVPASRRSGRTTRPAMRHRPPASAVHGAPGRRRRASRGPRVAGTAREETTRRARPRICGRRWARPCGPNPSAAGSGETRREGLSDRRSPSLPNRSAYGQRPAAGAFFALNWPGSSFTTRPP